MGCESEAKFIVAFDGGLDVDHRMDFSFCLDILRPGESSKICVFHISCLAILEIYERTLEL